MGWYDAFKGDVARVDTRAATTNAGAGASAFGDAFEKIGTSLINADKAEVDKLAQAKTNEFTDMKIQEIKDERLDKAGEFVQTEDNNDYLSLANAFEGNYKDFKNANPLDDTNSVTPETHDKTRAIFNATEKKAQGLFNDEAIEVSVTGAYKNMKDFTAGNPELIKNADGATMAKIDKYYTDKDTSLLKLNAKEKDIKHATALNKMSAQVVKAQKKANKDAFKYTEVTDAKIASQVKTAMGMDAEDFSFTDASKVAYQDAVAGSAKISKAYNLEPSLAIHVYQNQEMYDFTADGKVIVKKQAKKPEENKDPLGLR